MIIDVECPRCHGNGEVCGVNPNRRSPAREGGGALIAALFLCLTPVAVDGDTLRCGSELVRLIGIDAPELPGHCRKGRVCTPGDGLEARRVLHSLVRRGPDFYAIHSIVITTNGRVPLTTIEQAERT